MSFFDHFRKKQEQETSKTNKLTSDSLDFDPNAHHQILEYLRKIWSGESSNPEFEQKSLNRDLKFNSLNLTELFFSLSEEHEIPSERIAHFLRVGILGGGDNELATLLERIVILAEQFDESQRIVLLSSGVVGDRKEIMPINAEFDNVGFIVKFCAAIKNLKKLEGHGAIDLEYAEIEEDPGWK
jgi:acyl carrier protein